MSANARARLSMRSGQVEVGRAPRAGDRSLLLVGRPGEPNRHDVGAGGVEPHSRWDRWESRLCFWLPVAVFIALGAVLVFGYASLQHDATARVADAYYVLFSRDPHLAAVGFVWNPLPSLTVLPLLPLKVLWPALTERAFAGNISSAVFMAGAVWMTWRILVDLAVSRPVRLVLTGLFFVNPMILYYGANGMSEALFLFTLLLATRFLVDWLATDRLRSLVLAGSALGLAYLARNEAVTAAAAATALVAVVRVRRAMGTTRQRFDAAITDAAIVSLPFAVCFVGWAVVSWVIVGHPFEQFSSVYGTSSQLRVVGAGIRSTQGIASNPLFLTVELLSLAPCFLVTTVGAVVAAGRRRDPSVLGLLAINGGVVAFAAAAFVAGQTAGYYRYYISIVPLSVLLTGFLFAGGRTLWPGRSATPTRRAIRWVAVWSVALAMILAGSAVDTSFAAMTNPGIGREEYRHIATMLYPGRHGSVETSDGDWYHTVSEMASFVDHMGLPSGSILVDTFSPCVPELVLAVHHPKVFVITNDRDFQPALADPSTFHVRYLMVPESGAYTSLDAVFRAHPDPSAGGFATLSHSFAGKNSIGCPSFGLWSIRS